MQMPGRRANTGEYRYGFNGMESDDEVKGTKNSYDFGARIYDPRVGRWLSRDPLESAFPWQSPYVAFDNNPIFYNDPNGESSEPPPGHTNYLKAEVLDANMLKRIEKKGLSIIPYSPNYESSLIQVKSNEGVVYQMNNALGKRYFKVLFLPNNKNDEKNKNEKGEVIGEYVLLTGKRKKGEIKDKEGAADNNLFADPAFDVPEWIASSIEGFINDDLNGDIDIFGAGGEFSIEDIQKQIANQQNLVDNVVKSGTTTMDITITLNPTNDSEEFRNNTIKAINDKYNQVEKINVNFVSDENYSNENVKMSINYEYTEF